MKEGKTFFSFAVTKHDEMHLEGDNPFSSIEETTQSIQDVKLILKKRRGKKDPIPDGAKVRRMRKAGYVFGAELTGNGKRDSISCDFSYPISVRC